MKRPLLTVGLCWLFATGVLVLLGPPALLWLPAPAFCLLAAALWLNHKVKPTLIAAALSVLAACGVFWLHTTLFIAPLQRLAGQSLPFRGTVTALRPAGRATAYDLYGRFEGEGLPTRAMTLQVLALGGEELEVGDQISGTFFLELPSSPRRMLAHGRAVQAKQGEIAPAHGRLPTGSVVWGALLRQRLLAALERSIPGQEGALVAGLLLSEQTEIAPDTAANLRRSGAAHILTVSGYHLSVAVGLVLMLSGPLKWGKGLTNLAAAACCLLLMTMVGFTPSITRSGIMTLLWLLGRQLGRRGDSLTSLAFAAVVMLAANPYVLFSVGFILSLSSVLSITLFAGPVQRFLTRRLIDKGAEPGRAAKFMLTAFSVSLGASVLVYPIQAALFGVLPAYGVVGNLLLAPLVPVVIIFGAVVAFLGLLGLWLPSAAAGWVAGQAAGLIASVSGFVSSLPGSWQPVTQGYQLFWLFGAAAVLIGLAALRPNYRVCLFTVTALVLPLLLGSFSWSVLSHGSVRLVSWDDNGSLAVLRGDTAVVLGVSAQKGDAGAQRLATALEELGAKKIHLMLDDSNTAPMARTAAQIQRLHPAVAVLPAHQWGAAAYLPEDVTLWPRENIQITALGGVELTPTDRGMTLIQIGDIRVLKLADGYDIITEERLLYPYSDTRHTAMANDTMGQNRLLGNLDVIISPQGDFELLNPNIRVWHDLAGRKTIQLRITDEM